MSRVIIIVALLAAVSASAADPLTFEEALALASRDATATETGATLASLRVRRLPEVRLETTGNTGRIVDPYTADLLDTEALTTALAVHYPLWDGGAHKAQVEALEARASSRPSDLTDARFTTLVSAFGDLYVTQRQEAILRPTYEMLRDEVERSSRLLEAGELTALEASSRRALAGAYASQLLDVEARRDEATARLQPLLGMPAVPDVILEESAMMPAIDANALIADDRVRAATRALEESRARERAVKAASGFTATLSALAGATTARSGYRDLEASGTYGIYGLRVHLSYPIFRNASVAAAEARLAVQESARLQAEGSEAAKEQLASLQRQEVAFSRRIGLLQQQLEETRLAEASVERLVQAGLRASSEVAVARADVAGRRAALVAAIAERWKIVQQLRRMVERRERA